MDKAKPVNSQEPYVTGNKVTEDSQLDFMDQIFGTGQNMQYRVVPDLYNQEGQSNCISNILKNVENVSCGKGQSYTEKDIHTTAVNAKKSVAEKFRPVPHFELSNCNVVKSEALSEFSHEDNKEKTLCLQELNSSSNDSVQLNPPNPSHPQLESPSINFLSSIMPHPRNSTVLPVASLGTWTQDGAVHQQVRMIPVARPLVPTADSVNNYVYYEPWKSLAVGTLQSPNSSSYLVESSSGLNSLAHNSVEVADELVSIKV
nr:PREDICTED: uncharacterized protein LOC106705244 [Latimeria chalumnae]|eukprot:XP_014349579.1 PREDICTED: uncharacterized protein LOC106705244 [Latimeria chalumnae]